jgi:hypothetical protein
MLQGSWLVFKVFQASLAGYWLSWQIFHGFSLSFYENARIVPATFPLFCHLIWSYTTAAFDTVALNNPWTNEPC